MSVWLEVQNAEDKMCFSYMESWLKLSCSLKRNISLKLSLTVDFLLQYSHPEHLNTFKTKENTNTSCQTHTKKENTFVITHPVYNPDVCIKSRAYC